MKIKWLFFLLWILSILIFFVGVRLAPPNYGLTPNDPWSEFFGITAITGILFFVVMILIIILENNKVKSILLHKGKGIIKYAVLSLFILTLVSIGYLNYRADNQVAKQKQDTYKTLMTSTPTPAPTLNPVTTVKVKAVVNTDPIVNCGPGVNSKQYIKDKSSNCKNYVDCGLNNNTVWTLMLNSECIKKHNEANQNITSPSNTQNSIDSAKANAYNICSWAYQNTLNSCKGVCDSKLSEDRNTCVWAYTGSNPGIELNIDKYGECLSGPGGADESYGNCLQTCTDQYAQNLKKCSQ